jgi:hypothetical protein
MARTRFEWTMIMLSFLGGGWVTWTALDPISSAATESARRNSPEQPAAAESDRASAPHAEPAPAAAEVRDTGAAPVDASRESAASSAPSVGEQLQIRAVEGWRKLKQRANDSKWKKELTDGVEGTAEKWWSGVREALGAAPSRATTEADSAPQPAPPAPTAPPANGPDAKPAVEPQPPPNGAGASGQIGEVGRQIGWRRALGWLQGRFQAP